MPPKSRPAEARRGERGERGRGQDPACARGGREEGRAGAPAPSEGASREQLRLREGAGAEPGQRRPPEEGRGKTAARPGREVQAAQPRQRPPAPPGLAGRRPRGRPAGFRGQRAPGRLLAEHAPPLPAPPEETTPLRPSGRRRASAAIFAAPRPAAPAAARHLLGPPYLPREEDGGAHHTHKTWLPFKTKTSRGPARAGAHLRTTW